MKWLRRLTAAIAWCVSEASLRVLLPTFFLVTTQAASAGVIALNSELYLQAQARSNGSATVLDTDQQSQLSSLNNLNASVSASAISSGGFATASGSGSATWVNAAQGQVLFNDVGFDTFNNTANTLVTVGGPALWSYNFIADVSGIFTMDWSVFVEGATTNTFGLGGFRFSLSGAGGGQTVFPVGGIGARNSGTTTRNIVAGHEYTALISNDTGLFGGVGTRTAFMDGSFDWHMDSGPFESVPEPTSMSLFLLAVCGLALRKRQLRGTKVGDTHNLTT